MEAPGSSGDRAVSHVRDMPVNPFVNGRRAKPRYDVAELYSPPRLNQLAKKWGLQAGWSFDHLHEDPLTGKSYDLLRLSGRDDVLSKLEHDGVEVLTASPPCTVFSIANQSATDP